MSILYLYKELVPGQLLKIDQEARKAVSTKLQVLDIRRNANRESAEAFRAHRNTNRRSAKISILSVALTANFQTKRNPTASLLLPNDNPTTLEPSLPF